MKKTILFLVIVLLFSCTSIQAKMSMRIISRNMRSHEDKTVVDNEEKKEATKAVEVEEAKEDVEVTEATKAAEAIEAAKVEAAEETVEVTEATEVTEVAEVAEVTETVEVTEVVDEAEVAEATEAVEAAEAAEATEIVEVTEVVDEAETAEVTETVEAAEVTEIVEATETVEATQAKMPMRIISRYKRLYEEKVVADNGEKKEATKSAEIEEAKEEVEVTEATKAVDATETPEVTEAVAVDAVAGTTEIKEVAETTEAAGAIESAEVEEVKEAAEITEVTKAVEVTEVSEATKPVEVTESKEIKEPTETGPVDYEALGLRSVELNPNDYPDEVIALLEPYKNNEKNNSVLFYSSLGLAYKSKGRLKAAIAAYKRALKLVPSVPAPSIQYNLGIAYYYNNELHKSFSCFLNSSAQRPDHLGTEKWIKQLADELDIYKVPNTSKLQLVVNQKISVNRKKDDRESRLRMYLTQDGGCIQELSVKDKIYSYGIDSDIKRPVDYIIIDNDGDGSFDSVVNNKGKFGVPTWAYNPD